MNNPGVNERDLQNLSLKMDWDMAAGTFTSITSYDAVEELLTGDAFDFVPTAESIGVAFGFTDQNQSQFLDVEALSQEFRFTSPSENRRRWIAGTYMVATERFISTGSMVDTGGGVFPVFRQPRGRFPYDFATDAVNPQATYLADDQDNFAWAVFGELAFDVSDATEIAFSMRYDDDERENTTETPTAFLPNVAGLPQGFTDSEITDSLNPADIGDRAPNVSRYTFNLGLNYARPIPALGDGMEFFARMEYQIIGETAFFDNEQPGTNDRDDVHLADFRAGIEMPDDWTLTAWARNAFNDEYNAEYSTGGFVFKGMPRRWGVDFMKRF